jgi:hypothetical protein
MKTGILIIYAGLFFGTLQAQQTIEKHISFSGKEDIKMDIQIADSITLQTWNKDEVFVTASVNINDNKDNGAYETSFDESGSSIGINARFRENYFKGRDNCCNESDIYWKIFIPENAKFSVETINANITITGKTADMKVKSISGYIDLAVPENKPANLELSTISGTIYSNHDLTPENSHSGIPSVIREKINAGGTSIKLETISGDLFFRKSN